MGGVLTAYPNTWATIMYQLMIPALLLVQCAHSLPQYAAPAPAYKAVEKPLPPQPYTYQYGVADDYSKANYQKLRVKMKGAMFKENTPLLFLMAGSSIPSTLLILLMATLLM